METIIGKHLAVLNNGENKHSSFSMNCIMLASYFLPVIVGNRYVSQPVARRGPTNDVSIIMWKELFKMMLLKEQKQYVSLNVRG